MNKFLRLLHLRAALSALAVAGLCYISSAQQGHIYNQFFMNPYMYNPAYAGVDGHGVVFAMYKQQYTGIAEGPTISHASYHKPLKGGIGFGVTAFNESLGPLTSSAGKVTGSYLVNIDRKHFLRLGMSLGMGSNTVTIPEDGIGDPAFQGSGSTYLIGDFGATYHFDHFNVGFSLPNLFTPQLVSDGFSELNINPLDRMLFKMNYRGHISHEIAIEPHILYRYSNVLPSQYEIATIVHLMHVAWVGGTFRQDAGFIALVGAKVKHKIAIGAAYELGNSTYNSVTGSTFEIHVGMHMGGHKEKKLGHVDHHKTWFSTHSDELVAKAAAKARRDSLLALQKTEELTIIPTTPVVTKPPVKKSAGWTINGINLERNNDAGIKETAYGVAPARGEGSSWAISPATSNFDERDRADGKREVAIKWVRIGAGGSMEESIVWTLIGEPPAQESLTNNVTPTKEPVTEPVKEPIKEPVKEPVKEPIKDPVVTKPVVITPTPTATDNRTYQELATTGKPLEVKRGNNILELPVGNYLIGGVFDDFDEAENRSDQMFHKGFREVRVGYVSARKHYYVILKSYKTVELAQQDKAKVQATAGLKDVWVLKVNE